MMERKRLSTVMLAAAMAAMAPISPLVAQHAEALAERDRKIARRRYLNSLSSRATASLTDAEKARYHEVVEHNRKIDAARQEKLARKAAKRQALVAEIAERTR